MSVSQVLLALELDITSEENSKCSWGGPVQNELCLIVHAAPPSEHDTWNLSDRISVGGNRALLSHCDQHGSPFRLILGYAGWGPGQLVSEIERGDWLYSEATPELIFETPMSAMYDVALSDFGMTENSFYGSPIDN